MENNEFNIDENYNKSVFSKFYNQPQTILFWKNADNNIGIQTTNPIHKLHIMITETSEIQPRDVFIEIINKNGSKDEFTLSELIHFFNNRP